jgi:hypothetical protein
MIGDFSDEATPNFMIGHEQGTQIQGVILGNNLQRAGTFILKKNKDATDDNNKEVCLYVKNDADDYFSTCLGDPEGRF